MATPNKFYSETDFEHIVEAARGRGNRAEIDKKLLRAELNDFLENHLWLTDHEAEEAEPDSDPEVFGDMTSSDHLALLKNMEEVKKLAQRLACKLSIHDTLAVLAPKVRLEANKRMSAPSRWKDKDRLTSELKQLGADLVVLAKSAEQVETFTRAERKRFKGSADEQMNSMIVDLAHIFCRITGFKHEIHLLPASSLSTFIRFCSAVLLPWLAIEQAGSNSTSVSASSPWPRARSMNYMSV